MNRQQALEILGLNEDQLNVSNKSAVLKAAYRKRALVCHPDKNPDNPAAQKAFTDLTDAYQMLESPEALPRGNKGKTKNRRDFFNEVFGDDPFPDYADLREQTTEEIVRKFMWGEKGKDPGEGKYAITLMLTYRRMDALTGYTVLRQINEDSLDALKSAMQKLLYDRKENPCVKFSAKDWFGKQDGLEAIVDILVNHQHLLEAHFGVNSVPIPQALNARLKAHVETIRSNTEDWQMKFARAFEKREAEKKQRKQAGLTVAGDNASDVGSDESVAKAPAAPKRAVPKTASTTLPKPSSKAPLPKGRAPSPAVVAEGEDLQPAFRMHWHNANADKPPYRHAMIGASVVCLLMLTMGSGFFVTVLSSLTAFAATYFARKVQQHYACGTTMLHINTGNNNLSDDDIDVFNMGVESSTSNRSWLQSFKDIRCYKKYDKFLVGKHMRDHAAGLSDEDIKLKPNRLH